MSFMRKEDKTSITTIIPADITHDRILAALHDHDILLKLDPQVEGYTPTAKPNEYSVSGSKKPTFEEQITDHAQGCDTEISAHPPPGLLKIWSKYRVSRAGNGNWKLQEDVRIECSRLILSKVKNSIVEEHPKAHVKIFEAAKARH